MLKRTMCAVLALVMLVCAFPLTALAEENNALESVNGGSFPAMLTGETFTESYMYESENNNSRSKADYIAQDYTFVSGQVGSSGDSYDFFKITLKESYYLEFAGISGADNKNTTRFKLTKSSGSVLKTASYIGTGGDGYDDEYSMKTTLAPGTYYIRVNDSKHYVDYQFVFFLYPAVDAPKVSASNKASSGKPVLKWSAVDGAANYRIYRATSKDGTYKYLDSTKKTSFTDTTAKAGRKYYYKVKTMSNEDSVKDSKYSSVVSVTCDCARPDVWLTHRSTTGKNIVKWDEVSGAEKYKVYVATSKSGTYKCIGTTSKLQLVHSSGASNKMYYYKVKAISGSTSAANSAYSLVVGQKTK